MVAIGSSGSGGFHGTQGKPAFQQPKFDARIYGLRYPLQGKLGSQGTLKRGYMIWAQTISGVTSRASVHFLYNPSTVEADYPLSDATVGASLLFPNPGDKADLRVPLQQTVSWSVLYDRTYELWESYNPDGSPKFSPGPNGNDPRVVGVIADIMQFQQFTGMTVNYNSTGTPVPGFKNLFIGHQGILQLIPAYVYFGGAEALAYYGYVSEWDVQVTHWTQYMVPMRCVINVSFTMLPQGAVQKGFNPGTAINSNWGGPPSSAKNAPAANLAPNTAGVGGR
jgi:hypothetical protein